MIFGIEFYAVTFDFVGKFLLAFTAFLVHMKLSKEKKFDRHVLKEMKIEKYIGIFALVFLVIGYVLHVINFAS